jgi:ketopantoate reductase
LRIGVVGIGPVGAVLGAHLIEAGAFVVLCDVMAQKMDTIKSKGVKVSTPDLKPFIDRVKPVYDDFYQEFPELKPVVQKALSLR